MVAVRAVVLALLVGLAVAPGSAGGGQQTTLHSFSVTGVVERVNAGAGTVVIRHGAISNYMDAMTMPFKVKDFTEVAGLQTGDAVSFRLLVGEEESWIDRVTITEAHGRENAAQGVDAASVKGSIKSPAGTGSAPDRVHPLLRYAFTNELGRVVRLGDFRGQALALTFFFTRCPIPDYCPRLSKNFEEASRKLRSLEGGPTNWHFLSVTFDTAFDTPAVLKAYGKRYDYDPAHWSFLTGTSNHIAELAGSSDATFEADRGFFNHNFRTLIIDAAGRLQMAFPIGGNLSDAIVEQILQAAAVTNRPSSTGGEIYR